MKYRGIELIREIDREDELACGVEFKNPDEDDEISEEMQQKILGILDKKDIWIEQVLENFILVRGYDIPFNKDGIDFIKTIYDKLKENLKNEIITVEISIDNFLFKGEDGETYNQDSVSWEEFIENLEY